MLRRERARAAGLAREVERLRTEAVMLSDAVAETTRVWDGGGTVMGEEVLAHIARHEDLRRQSEQMVKGVVAAQQAGLSASGLSVVIVLRCVRVHLIALQVLLLAGAGETRELAVEAITLARSRLGEVVVMSNGLPSGDGGDGRLALRMVERFADDHKAELDLVEGDLEERLERLGRA